jgi:hypothetical protein
MRAKGLEPSLPKKLEPKSSASTIPPCPQMNALYQTLIAIALGFEILPGRSRIAC